MAKKVVLIDDISGDMIDEGLGRTVEFSVDHKVYSIDLGAANLDKFEAALKPYIKAAEQVEAPKRQASASPRRTASSASASVSREQREAIRTWANSNGYTVGDRGRIKAEIVEAFEKAHEGEA